MDEDKKNIIEETDKEIKKEESISEDKPIDELEVLKEKIKSLEVDLEKEVDAKLRFAADCQNIRMRFEREKQELLNMSKSSLLLKVLDIADDLRTVTLAGEDSSGWFSGVKMVYQKLIDTIKSEGVDLIEVNEGDEFLANVHEAIAFEDVATEDKVNKIVKVIAQGYKRSDNQNAIKMAKVIVGRLKPTN